MNTFLFLVASTAAFGAVAAAIMGRSERPLHREAPRPRHQAGHAVRSRANFGREPAAGPSDRRRASLRLALSALIFGAGLALLTVVILLLLGALINRIAL